MSQQDISLQLPVEKALKAFINAQDILAGIVLADIHCAHEVDKAQNPNFVAVIADLPDWITESNLQLRVTFQLSTHIADGDKRANAIALHSKRLGNIIDLFAPENFRATFAGVNPPVEGADNRAWKGLGFSGWQALPGEDGHSETGAQLVAKINYLFLVHLEE